MRVGLIARLEVKPTMLEAFEKAFIVYQQKVRSREPGNLLFQLNRSRTEVGVYVVMEQYADDAALQLHRESAHYKEIPQIFAGCLESPPDIQVFDCID